MIWVPRVNTVDGITEQHVQQWRWRVSDKVINPDYQSRIKNIEIRWQVKSTKNPWRQTYEYLPPHEELSLYHPKTIDKQEKQNKLHETL